jgi:hypothetical protein
LAMRSEENTRPSNRLGNGRQSAAVAASPVVDRVQALVTIPDEIARTRVNRAPVFSILPCGGAKRRAA